MNGARVFPSKVVDQGVTDDMDSEVWELPTTGLLHETVSSTQSVEDLWYGTQASGFIPLGFPG